MEQSKIEQFNLKLKNASGAVQSAAEVFTFVTFSIGDELYGVEVTRVHEIIGMVDITYVPQSRKFVKGVINLRGSVVPVIDMRIKFGMELMDFTQFTVIVIVEVKGRLVGMIVDSVSDVTELTADKISDSGNYKSTINADFIKGVGRIDEQILIIIEIDRLLNADENDNRTAEQQ